MTDTELPPCGLCGSGPHGLEKCIGVHEFEMFHCPNQKCAIYFHELSENDWRQLHGPAQVLREVDLICDGFINDTGYHDYYRDLAGRIKELIQKAQQLSGRE